MTSEVGGGGGGGELVRWRKKEGRVEEGEEGAVSTAVQEGTKKSSCNAHDGNLVCKSIPSSYRIPLERELP